MKNKESKTAIIERFKEVFKLNTNADLSRFLGISPATVSNWYTRNSLDYDLLFSKCEHINIDWLLTGEGEIFKNEKILDDVNGDIMGGT